MKNYRNAMKTAGKMLPFMYLVLMPFYGCSTTKTTEKDDVGQESFVEQNSHKDYRELLGKNEFIVPSDVFDAYIETADSSFAVLSSGILGTHIKTNKLRHQYSMNKFQRKLTALGYPETDIKRFYEEFSHPDNIVMRDSLSQKEFEDVLFHERFHKEISNLDKRSYSSLIITYQSIMSGLNAGDNLRSIIKKDPYFEIVYKEASMNWEEFYAYMADGRFPRSLVRVMEQHYYDALKIIEEIKEKTSVRIY